MPKIFFNSLSHEGTGKMSQVIQRKVQSPVLPQADKEC